MDETTTRTSKYALDLGVRWMPKKAAWHSVSTEPDGHCARCKFVPAARWTLLAGIYTEEVCTVRTSSKPVDHKNEPNPRIGVNDLPDMSVPKTSSALQTGGITDIPFKQDRSSSCERPSLVVA